MLSRDDIHQALLSGSLKIYPFEEKSLTGIGYNLSTTSFAFSINRGTLLAVRERPSSKGAEHYIEIPPCDTVLLFSKEYVEVDETLAGTFHSKVSCVCRGLGHVSTTLDPTWKGQLIVSVSNPTSQGIEFSLDGSSGNILTMLLYKLDTPVSGPDIHDNNQGRCDLLFRHFVEPSKGVKDRMQHLLLRDFALGEYADSLNGYDSFLEGYDEKDRYTVMVSDLTRLRNSLKTDLAIISDGAPYGRTEYCVARDETDRKMIKGCVLSKIMEDGGEGILSPIKVGRNGSQSEIIAAINACIRIVEYELATINHIRRIRWQNRKVEEFASAESDLQVEQRRSELNNFIKGEMPVFVLIVLFGMGAVATVMNWFPIPDDISSPLLPALVSATVAFAIQLLQEWFKAFPRTKE